MERDSPEEAHDGTKRTDEGDGTGVQRTRGGSLEGQAVRRKLRQADTGPAPWPQFSGVPQMCPSRSPVDSLIKGQPGLPWQPPVQFSPELSLLT